MTQNNRIPEGYTISEQNEAYTTEGEKIEIPSATYEDALQAARIHRDLLMSPVLKHEIVDIGVQKVQMIVGSDQPGILRSIVVLLTNYEDKRYNMMEANRIYQYLRLAKPEILDAWRADTGVTDF